MAERFETQGRVTWVGDPAARPRGSTGKARELQRHRIYVDWGASQGGWERRSDLRPGFVPVEDLPEWQRASLTHQPHRPE